MRVLVAHNYYVASSPSGENRAVDVIVDCLSRNGAEVDVLEWHSDDLQGLPATHKMRIAAQMAYSRAPGELVERIESFQPDVVQIHNPIPRLAPRDIAEVQRRGVPVVQVVHNYRHSCLSGTHQLSNRVCTVCAGSRWSRAPGIRNGCYRESFIESALLALSETAHHRLWRKLDGYVSPSEHVRQYLIENGFPSSRIAVVPNPVPASNVPPDIAGEDVLYAGRLVPEKGIDLLLAAWADLTEDDRAGRTLHIAGSGPEEPAVVAASMYGAKVKFHGLLDERALARLGGKCALSVVPSQWDEPFGLVAVEALAAGRGIVVSDRGALPEIASDPRCAWSFGAGRDGLAPALRHAMSQNRLAVSHAARQCWRDRFSPAVAGRAHYEYLTSVVAEARSSWNHADTGRRHA